MKMIKKFEGFDNVLNNWEDDMLLIYDYFAEINDMSEIGSVKYKIGYIDSFGITIYPCEFDVKTEEIKGDKLVINNSILRSASKLVFEVLIIVDYKNNGYSPFRRGGHSTSFYNENADIFVKIITMIGNIKYKLSDKYKMNIIPNGRDIYVNFLKK